MKILNSYLDFKNEIKEVEVVGSAVFSTDSEGRVWHDTTREIERLRSKKTFVMIYEDVLSQIAIEPSKISPIHNSSIYEVDFCDLEQGDKVVVLEGGEIIKYQKTDEEIQKETFRNEAVFYNGELEFASKANVELVCGIITEDIFEEVKTYMKSIDPYAGIKTIPEVKRPEIFKKYL